MGWNGFILVSHIVLPLPLGGTAAAAARPPPDPHPNDAIVRNASELQAALLDSQTRVVPLSLHVIGHILLSGAGFSFAESQPTSIVVSHRQRVTLWSADGDEGTLDAEGLGRVFFVRCF